jgi:hypothetical protein
VNNACSTTSFHNGVSPTPGSKIARSSGVSASASASAIDSAPEIFERGLDAFLLRSVRREGEFEPAHAIC